MADDDNKHQGQFDASLPLPGDNADNAERQPDKNPAAELIRKKVEAAYGREPDAEQEMTEAEVIKPAGRSKHQEFIYNLTSSGRPLHEIQAAWHEYYAGLTDTEKHQVWQEFYSTQTQAARHPAATRLPAETHAPKPASRHPVTHPHHASHQPHQTAKPKRQPAAAHHTPKTAARQGLHSLLFGLGVGSIVILIFLFGFFNERIIAPFIQPSRNVNNIQFISDSPAGSQPLVIIPKINVEIPVVYGVNTISDADVENALEDGVVHYADTPLPGQNGNVVIVGHSSNNLFNPGKYKYAFVLLHDLVVGDTFYLQKDGRRYTYQIYKREVVTPNDVSVLGSAGRPATASLITCDPPGTSYKRLVVIGEQISPSPADNSASTTTGKLAASTTLIPGNSPSLWSRFTNWFAH